MPANTTFRMYRGPFSISQDLTGPDGAIVSVRAFGTFDAFQVNEAGMIAGTVVTNTTITATISAPGLPSRTETETLRHLAPFSQPLYDFFVIAESFASAQAKISYSFATAGSDIVLRVDTVETVQNLPLLPGVNGTSTFSATLTAPFNENRVVQSQTFQSLLPSNVFTGWSGLDTVEYSQSPRRVIADLQSGYGVNAFGGTDQYSSIENLTGSPFNDILAGDAGANVFFGGGGSDTLTGRGGRDIAEFSGSRAICTIEGSGATVSVTGVDDVDTLEGIERLQFSASGVAFDLGPGESTGMAVRVIGAAFDTQNASRELVGIGIDLFDEGTSMLRVCELALETDLFASIAGSRSNVDFVNTVYRNIVGVLPTPSARDSLVSLLQGSGGPMTQAQLLMLAANVNENAANIDLVGLQQSGVEFV